MITFHENKYEHQNWYIGSHLFLSEDNVFWKFKWKALKTGIISKIDSHGDYRQKNKGIEKHSHQGCHTFNSNEQKLELNEFRKKLTGSFKTAEDANKIVKFESITLE